MDDRLQIARRPAVRSLGRIKVRAERKTGELLAQMPKNQGAVKGKTSIKGKGVLDQTPTLKTLGVSFKESSTWQQLAKIPEPEFEKRLDACYKE